MLNVSLAYTRLRRRLTAITAPFDQICTKSFVGWGFVPDPTGELIALPQTPNWFRGGTPGEVEDRGETKGGEG